MAASEAGATASDLAYHVANARSSRPYPPSPHDPVKAARDWARLNHTPCGAACICWTCAADRRARDLSDDRKLASS